MNTVDPQPLYGWNTLDWRKIERRVFKLQTRIYRAQRRGESKTVRKLQRLLMKTRSATRKVYGLLIFSTVALLAFVLLTILDSGLMRPTQGFAVQRMTLRVSLAPLV